MAGRKLTKTRIKRYKDYLKATGKSQATVEKYMRDINTFIEFVHRQKVSGQVSREIVEKYQESLSKSYKISSTNSMMVAINSFLAFQEWRDCQVPLYKRPDISDMEDIKLTKEEYYRLVEAARDSGNLRLCMMIQTIATAGIHVRELEAITVEAVKAGVAYITYKEKTRAVHLLPELCEQLLTYCRKKGIKKGAIFVSHSGNLINRSNIWKMMKSICDRAEVAPQKVYPNNLLRITGCLYYTVDLDIVSLEKKTEKE